MSYIVYKTTCISNKKIYIGVHKTDTPYKFDGYLGCGVNIKIPSSYSNAKTPFIKAVQKYGTNNFIRETLYVYITAEEAYNKEADIVDMNFIQRKDVYNIKVGGYGGRQEGSYNTKNTHIKYTRNNYYIIYQFNSEGLFIKSFLSSELKTITSNLNVSKTAIYNALHYGNSCKGYYFSYSNTINIKTNVQSRTKVFKYTDAGIYVECYDSISKAALKNNLQIMTLERAIKGGYKINNSYYSTMLLDNYKGKSKISLKNKILYVYDLQGNFITDLKSSKDIYNFFNIKTTSSITTAIRCNRPYKEYQLSIIKKNSLPPLENKRNSPKQVEVLNSDNMVIETYTSISAASKIYGTGVGRAVKYNLLYKNHYFKLR